MHIFYYLNDQSNYSDFHFELFCNRIRVITHCLELFFFGGGPYQRLVELERDMVAGPQYEEQEQELNLELLAGQEWGLERE